jgi:hypothetical protein
MFLLLMPENSPVDVPERKTTCSVHVAPFSIHKNQK